MTDPITTEQQLQAAMLADEREHLEFKSAENSFASEDLFKYCVALSNEGGGNLVLGVTDKKPRSVVGTACFPEIEKIKTRILDTLKFRVDVFEITSAGKRVLAFYSPPRPVGTPRAYQGRYMMRSGELLVAMTPEVLERVFAEFSPTTRNRSAKARRSTISRPRRSPNSGRGGFARVETTPLHKLATASS